MTLTLYRDKFGLPQARTGGKDRRLAAYLETDVQENETVARELLEDLIAVGENPADSREIIGNAYALTLTADEVTISDLYDNSSALYRTSVDHFRQVLKEWLAFIAGS